MFTNRLFNLSVVAGLIALMLLTACAPKAAPTTASSSSSKSISTSTASPTPAPWSLVVVGDSIPYNSLDDCPGCKSFVNRYAEAITVATGHAVTVRNLSQHNGLQIDGLLQELKTDTARIDALAHADIIIVSIGGNDTPWGRNDDPCDGPNNEDWSKYTETCAAAAAEIFRPKFESVHSQIVALRAGKPTIFLTLNVNNDWIGVDGVPPEATEATHMVLEAWNTMLCEAATSNGFTCADIYHAFNGTDGLTPAGNLLASDTVHPSNKGNEVIAQVLTDLGFAPLVP